MGVASIAEEVAKLEETVATLVADVAVLEEIAVSSITEEVIVPAEPKVALIAEETVVSDETPLASGTEEIIEAESPVVAFSGEAVITDSTLTSVDQSSKQTNNDITIEPSVVENVVEQIGNQDNLLYEVYLGLQMGMICYFGTRNK